MARGTMDLEPLTGLLGIEEMSRLSRTIEAIAHALVAWHAVRRGERAVFHHELVRHPDPSGWTQGA